MKNMNIHNAPGETVFLFELGGGEESSGEDAACSGGDGLDNVGEALPVSGMVTCK